MPQAAPALLKELAVSMVKIYRNTLRYSMLPTCRFTPSCSEYAQEAFETHGLTHGTWMTLKRLGRCHPFGRVGFDPVK